MKMKLLLLLTAILCAVLAGSPSQGSEIQIDPESYLTKVRSRLLGDWPTTDEWEELSQEMARRKCDETSCLGDFFERKIRKYMQEKNFISNMSIKVDEMIWIRSAEAPLSSLKDPSAGQALKYSGDFMNALNDLSRRVFEENLSWDDLFTAQKYRVYSNQFRSDQNEIAFFDQKTPTPDVLDALGSFPADLTGHPNASGIFSTPRFTTRFWNSSLNQNRKRAAAIFRILLCDTMVPALERKSQDAEEKSKALGINPDYFREMHQGQRLDRHAADPACLKCHQRLEPMAWTLRGIENRISKVGFPGRLRYYLPNGELTKIPAKDFGSLIRIATEQPRYRWCQVDRFMSWTIGNDVHVSEKRRQEFEAEFDRLGRKTNDFLVYLLRTKEFADGQEEIPLASKPSSDNTQKAFAVFKNCNGCHGGTIPFQKGVQSVFRVLDLAHDGKSRSMPPVESNWQPSMTDVQVIKRWILDGAPNLQGRPQIAEPALLFKEAR